MNQSRSSADLAPGAERFQNILDCLPQMVWANEADGRQYYNERWREFTGVNIDCNDDLDRFALIHPDDEERARTAWAQAQVTGKYVIEYRLRHNTGEYRWIISRGAPIRDESGRITAWYGTCTDNHDRRLYREALSLSEALNRSMIEASPDPILLVGPDATIIFMNEASRIEVGIKSAEDAAGKRVTAFLPSSREMVRALNAALRGRRTRLDIEIAGVSGAKWWDVSLAPVSTDEGTPVGVLVVGRDITEAIAAARKLEELQNEIIHVSRLSAMGTMAATLAHELNQPLAAAANYMRAGRHLATGQNGDLSEALGEAERQIQRAGEIIRRARGMMQKESLRTQPASLTRIANGVFQLCRSASVCPDVDVAVQISKEADQVLVDLVQTEQVLANLVRNACEAMREVEGKRLVVRARKEGAFCVVEVADTGPGIPPGCDVFRTTESDRGLGLGLAISRTIVERQGGQMWTAPNETGGSSFFFTLPLARTATP